MNVETIKEAAQLAQKIGYSFVATADTSGRPHVATAGRLALSSEGHIVVAEWFCPGTVANLQVNPRISLVVWDAATDNGYQLIGELEKMKDLGILNGYAPQVEGKSPLPQVERQLLVHVDKIIEFKRAPHSDVEE